MGTGAAQDVQRLLADPADPGWGEPFPEWVREFRPAQRDAIAAVVDAFDSGTDKVVLSAPTGSGKTLIADAVRRLLGVRGTYVCTDKGLQDQVVEDFGAYARVLKGRSNYPTLDGPDDATADDCQGVPDCRFCEPNKACPYLRAKREAAAADLAVLNTAYLLAEANSGDHAAFTDRDLVIADEADRLESILMGYVGVQVSKRRLEEWGVAALESGTPMSASAEWVERLALPAATEAIRRRVVQDPEGSSVRVQREIRGLQNLRDDLRRVLKDLPGNGWVTCQNRGAVEFKPIRVAADVARCLWPHASRWLLMSATVLSADKMMADLGVDDPWSFAEVDMPSTFPVANRPVYLCDVADVTHKNPGAPELVASAVAGLLARHVGDRVLVHTVSFKLQQRLREILPRSDRYVWYESGQRGPCLDRYLDGSASVLFAPSLERGVDLPDDACRAVVVCKVPYPDLGDAQVKARLDSGDRAWYVQQALRSLVQMSGRGVRHERDVCPTYVLDKQASRLVSQYMRDLPKWWVEAVQRGMPE